MNSQGDLFSYPNAPGFKEVGGTSEKAAKIMEPYAKTLAARAWRLLLKQKLTADEVAKALGVSILSIRPRISELHALGLARKTKERRLNDSGLEAWVWEGINPNG